MPDIDYANLDAAAASAVEDGDALIIFPAEGFGSEETPPRPLRVPMSVIRGVVTANEAEERANGDSVNAHAIAQILANIPNADELAALRRIASAIEVETETNQETHIADHINGETGYHMPAAEDTHTDPPTNESPDSAATLETLDLGGENYVRVSQAVVPSKTLLGFRVKALALPSADADVAHSGLVAFRRDSGNVVELRINHAGEIFLSDGSNDYYPMDVQRRRYTLAVGDTLILALRVRDGVIYGHFCKNGEQDNDVATAIVGGQTFDEVDFGWGEGITLDQCRLVEDDGTQPSHAQLPALAAQFDTEFVFGLITATTTSVEHVRFTEPVLTKRARVEADFGLGVGNAKDAYARTVITGGGAERISIPVPSPPESAFMNFHNLSSDKSEQGVVWSFTRDGRINIRFSIGINANAFSISAFPIYAELYDIGETLQKTARSAATQIGFDVSHYSRLQAGDDAYVPFTINMPSRPVEAGKYYALVLYSGAIVVANSANFLSTDAFPSGLIVEEVE